MSSLPKSFLLQLGASFHDWPVDQQTFLGEREISGFLEGFSGEDYDIIPKNPGHLLYIGDFTTQLHGDIEWKDIFFQRDPNDQRTGTFQLGKVREQKSLCIAGVYCICPQKYSGMLRLL